jgi:hypothetical protein
MNTEIIKDDITNSNAESNSPRVTTGFNENGVGIDPPDCGCTDCIIGDSIPFDTSHSKKLALLAFQVQNQGRKFYSRLGKNFTLIPYEDGWDFGFVAVQMRDSY